MFCIVETGGKQYKVSVGEVFNVEKLDANVNDNVELKVLMLVDGKKADIFLQGIEALNDFLGNNWDKNINPDEIENGIQTRLNEIADNIDITKLENFEYS